MTDEILAELDAQDGVEVRDPYWRESVKKKIVGKSRTKQEFSKEANINWIMKNYAKTSVIKSLNPRSPLYQDNSTVQGLQESLELVAAAQDDFGALPSEVRRAASNDPLQFAAMLSTQEGSEILHEAGLDIELPGPSPLELAQAEAAQKAAEGEAPPATPPASGGESP